MTSYSTNEKATEGQPDGSNNHSTKALNFSAKSTATEAQYKRIKAILRTGKTTDQPTERVVLESLQDIALTTTATEARIDSRLMAQGFGNKQKAANLIARLARAGHLVHECSEHSFTVVHPRWGMSRYCADFGALQSFARTVGALA